MTTFVMEWRPVLRWYVFIVQRSCVAGRRWRFGLRLQRNRVWRLYFGPFVATWPHPVQPRLGDDGVIGK